MIGLYVFNEYYLCRCDLERLTYSINYIIPLIIVILLSNKYLRILMIYMRVIIYYTHMCANTRVFTN